MTPKKFLQIGGIILVIVAILGFIGVIGPTAAKSIFKGAWVFDNTENWAHLIIGIAALIVVYAIPNLQKRVTWVVGVLALLVGLYNFASTTLLGAGLQRPLDLILHLVIGIWAVWSVMGKKKEAKAS